MIEEVKFGEPRAWTEADIGKSVKLIYPFGTTFITTIESLPVLIPYQKTNADGSIEQGWWGSGESVIGPLQEIGQVLAQAMIGLETFHRHKDIAKNLEDLE